MLHSDSGIYSYPQPYYLSEATKLAMGELARHHEQRESSLVALSKDKLDGSAQSEATIWSREFELQYLKRWDEYGDRLRLCRPPCTKVCSATALSVFLVYAIDFFSRYRSWLSSCSSPFWYGSSSLSPTCLLYTSRVYPSIFWTMVCNNLCLCRQIIDMYQ